jgi:hypothetical protein
MNLMPNEVLTGAAAIIRSLELLGIEDIFGLPGGAILPTYDPLMDSKKILVTLLKVTHPHRVVLVFALQHQVLVQPTW